MQENGYKKAPALQPALLFTSTHRIDFSNTSINFKGTIWVFLDNMHYSAANQFAVFCKATGFATLVGTETGGNGISSAPYMVTLPYPIGTVLPTPYRSTSGGPYSRGIHCSGWATLCSDAAFGSLSWRRMERPSWDQLRPGDIVEYKNEKSYH